MTSVPSAAVPSAAVPSALADPPSRWYVAVGTRPTSTEHERSHRVAGSAHLSLGPSPDALEPLNGDRGIVFARAVDQDIPGVRSTRTLRDPAIVEDPHGGYWLVAVRTLADGDDDPEARASLLVFRSANLLDYHELGLLLLDGRGVHGPSVRWDRAASAYRAWWTTDGGSEATAELPTLDPRATHAVPSPSPPSADATRPPAGGIVEIDPRTAGALRERFRRPGTIATSGAARGFPFIEDRADPCLRRHEGRWLFVATYDSGGANVTATHLALRAAARLEDLPAAPDHVILGRGGPRDLQGCFWAPELHVVGGLLTAFFAPSIGRADWTRVQAHLMQLRPGGDPTDAQDWGQPRPVRGLSGGPLGPDTDPVGISLDMTYVETGGKAYVVWSQRTLVGPGSEADLWIATVDPTRPDRLTSAAVRLVTPEYGWERNTSPVVEGPYVIPHGDDLWMIYACSGVGATYATGALRARADSDLLDPAAWSKIGHPLLESDPEAGVWGPGHATVTGHDGELLLVHHAMESPDHLGRHTGLGRVRWARDGQPVLEIAPRNARPATEVRR